jgi:hypothetical protein
MRTGSEHFQETERYLHSFGQAADPMAVAQLHATLAMTGALVDIGRAINAVASAITSANVGAHRLPEPHLSGDTATQLLHLPDDGAAK